MEKHRRAADGRRLCTAEFKREQLARVERQELTLAELARDLSISPSVVRRWHRLSSAGSYERVRDQLSRLTLETALAHLDATLERAQKEERLPVEVLDELLGLELSTRFERRIETNRELAGLPSFKTIESFDFAAQPEIPRATLEELATLRFLHQGENVLLLGPAAWARRT